MVVEAEFIRLRNPDRQPAGSTLQTRPNKQAAAKTVAVLCNSISPRREQLVTLTLALSSVFVTCFVALLNRRREDKQEDQPSVNTDSNWNMEESSSGFRSGDKYDRILEATIEVVARKGFQHARISDIASSAGVADGTVYLYFKNKNHILRAALNHAFQKFTERVSEALNSTSSPVEQLGIISRAHLETLFQNRPLAIIMQMQVRQSAKFLEQFSHQSFVDYINLVREIIRRGQQQNLIRPNVSDRLAALTLFGALDEVVSSWLYTGRAFDPGQTAAQVLDILLTGICLPQQS